MPTLTVTTGTAGDPLSATRPRLAMTVAWLRKGAYTRRLDILRRDRIGAKAPSSAEYWLDEPWEVMQATLERALEEWSL
jgi:hypothetical protein